MQEARDRRTVTIRQAHEISGVSRRTIYNWIRLGKVQFRRTAGGSVRIFEDTLWRDDSGQPLQQKQAS